MVCIRLHRACKSGSDSRSSASCISLTSSLTKSWWVAKPSTGCIAAVRRVNAYGGDNVFRYPFPYRGGSNNRLERAFDVAKVGQGWRWQLTNVYATWGGVLWVRWGQSRFICALLSFGRLEVGRESTDEPRLLRCLRTSWMKSHTSEQPSRS